jgi:putative DNA primase/helicase
MFKSPPKGRYLERRGCLPDEVEGIPPCLLYHPRLPYHDNGQLLSHNPTLIAKLEDIHHNLVTIQRIYLTPDGKKAYGKASKKLMETPIEGTASRAAIQLDEPGCMTLAIAEGLETTLWLRKRSPWPFWACYCADAMCQVQAPCGVREILIFPDAGRAGQTAAYDAAVRLTRKDFAVRIIAPDNEMDWDDMPHEGDDNV